MEQCWQVQLGCKEGMLRCGFELGRESKGGRTTMGRDRLLLSLSLIADCSLTQASTQVRASYLTMFAPRGVFNNDGVDIDSTSDAVVERLTYHDDACGQGHLIRSELDGPL